MQAGTQTYYCQYITHNTDFVFVFKYVYASVHGNQVQMQTGTYVNISVKKEAVNTSPIFSRLIFSFIFQH